MNETFPEPDRMTDAEADFATLEEMQVEFEQWGNAFDTLQQLSGGERDNEV